MNCDYSVEPRSREDLRKLALDIRRTLGLEQQYYFPIVELLDTFEITLEGFSYSIVPDTAFPPDKHADTNVYTGEIRIKESVYEGARKGCGRDRMTIAHEFAHFITLCFLGFKLNRVIQNGVCRTYENPEWQAKCLAGELLIPRHLTTNMSCEEIMKCCGVSKAAAKYQMDK